MLIIKYNFNAISPGENWISEIISFLWWKDTRSSRVSAFAIKKLPSLRPTAKAFPSGEKQQHLPPEREGKHQGVSGHIHMFRVCALRTSNYTEKPVFIMASNKHKRKSRNSAKTK